MSEAAEFATRRSGLGAGETPTASGSQPSSPISQFAALSSQHLAPGHGFSTEPSSQPPAPSRDALGCELVVETLRSFGQLRLRVNGASMLPAVWPGDILTITREAGAPPLPGDIVLFGREGRLVAHRVAEVRTQAPGARCQVSGPGNRELEAACQKPIPCQGPASLTPDRKLLTPDTRDLTPAPVSVPSIEFVTRGDSVDGNDRPISPDELLGRVTAIERGSRQFTPHQSAASRMASWVFRHSAFATRAALKIKGWGLENKLRGLGAMNSRRGTRDTIFAQGCAQ
jgi:hypothetical protein